MGEKSVLLNTLSFPSVYLYLGLFHHQHPLEHLGQIPQVEGVVGLGGGGQELGDNGVVHLDTSVHHLFSVLGTAWG